MSKVHYASPGMYGPACVLGHQDVSRMRTTSIAREVTCKKCQPLARAIQAEQKQKP